MSHPSFDNAARPNGCSRRDVLRGCLAAAASSGIASTGLSAIATSAGNPASQANRSGDPHMGTITTKDGTTIYYKDWGKGPVVTLSHGWPLNSDMWDGQMQIGRASCRERV